MTAVRRARVAGAVLLVAALAGACGGDDDGGVEEAKAPDAGDPSATLSIPLPDDATAVGDAADPGGEAYRLESDATLLDVNQFYVEQADGKPLRGYEWCGATRTTDTTILRVWKKSEAEQLRVELVDDGDGILIKAREDAAAPPTPCPPPAVGDPPFEGP